MSTRFSIRDLALQPGQHLSEELQVVLQPYRQAGFDYRANGGEVAAALDVTAMNDGMSLRLRFDAELLGPCARCLEDAAASLRIDSFEIHEPRAGDPELVSDFVSDDHVDLSLWATDAIGLEFPWRVLCRDDCKGLCPQCGANRNETACDCVEPIGDPRWDKLRDLRLDVEE